MMQEYDFYLKGCAQIGDTPLPEWQFRVAYGLYVRHFYNAVDIDMLTGEISLRKDYFPIVPWAKLRRLAKTVDRGRELAQSGGMRFEDDDDAGGPGVREPRHPVAPDLTGGEGRSFEPEAYDFDRSILH